jgi:flagellar basal-body rod protein FlgC
MGVTKVSSPIDIAISGLRAEGLRMNVIANNIANANTFQTGLSDAYRRKEVMLGSDDRAISGVRIEEILSDTSRELRRIHMPNHPAADDDGWVTVSNVDIPMELMQMVVASRSYQAIATIMRRWQDMMDVTIELLR